MEDYPAPMSIGPPSVGPPSVGPPESIGDESIGAPESIGGPPSVFVEFCLSFLYLKLSLSPEHTLISNVSTKGAVVSR
jgi:hypothetical protein